MRNSCGKSVSKGTPQAEAEGGSPVESEYLEWKSIHHQITFHVSAVSILNDFFRQKGYNLNFFYKVDWRVM